MTLKDNKIKIETVFALSSICCLLYMRYYESVLFYRHINFIFDTLYNYVAIPLFYFFISGCLFTILFKLLNTHLSQKTKRVYKLINTIILIIYIFFLLLKIIGYFTIGNLPFISVYWIIFIAWGCIFTINFSSSKKKGEEI